MPSVTTSAHWLTVGGILLLIRFASTVIGTVVFYVGQSEQPTRKSLAGFIRFCLPSQLWTSRCVRIDMWLVALRGLTGYWGAVPATAMILAISPPVRAGLTSLFGAHSAHPTSIVTSLLLMLIVLLVRDFCDFYTHLLSHRWQWLWEFHAMHHSATFLTPLSGKRSHVVDDLFHAGVGGVVLAVTVGVLAYCAAIPPVEITLFGVDAYLICHLLNFNQLQHSHVHLSFGRLERFFISPAQHHLHHDRDQSPRNLGALLSVWDRLFGTFAYSQKPGSFVVGLPVDQQPHYDSVVKLYLRPFQNCWANARRALSGSWRHQRINRRSHQHDTNPANVIILP